MGAIARVDDGKTLKKALVMVKEVVKKRNVTTTVIKCAPNVAMLKKHLPGINCYSMNILLPVS